MALETFGTKGELQADHALSAALFHETTLRGGQDKTVKLTDGTDKTVAALAKETPAERAGKAFETFAATRQLTPELKKQFEDAITEADKGPSSKTAGLEKEFADLEKELERVFPKDKQAEVEKLGKEAQDAFSKLPQDKQEQVGVLMGLRELLPEEDRKQIEDQLKQLAPDVIDKVIKIEQIQAPAIPVAQKMQEVGANLEMEKHHDSMTRLMYGIALFQSGDKVGAKTQISQAGIRNQALLENPNFVKLAQALGIDITTLKK